MTTPQTPPKPPAVAQAPDLAVQSPPPAPPAAARATILGMPDIRTPAAAAMWTVGVLVLSIVASIGWQLGLKLWGVF